MKGLKRKPTPGSEPSAADAPELPERWSAPRKTELVLRLLRGEALDAVSRESQVPAHELETWKRVSLTSGDRLVQVVDVRQQLADEKRVVRSEASRQAAAQGRKLLAQFAPRQVGQHVRVGGALDQGIQHGPGGHPEDIGGDRCQLDPRILQQLVQAIGGPAPLLDQHLAMPRQIAKLPNRRRRHEAAPQQPVLQQLRDPDDSPRTSVFRPGTCLMWVALTEQTREARPRGRRTQASSRHPCSPSPRASPRAPPTSRAGPRVRPRLSQTSARPAVGACSAPAPAHTRGDGVSMDIQPTAPLDQLFHSLLLRHRIDRGPEELPVDESARRAHAQQCGVPKAPTSDSSRTQPVPRCFDVARAAAGA